MAREKAMDEQARTETPPRDYAALREMVIGRWEELPRRLTQVAEYALNNPDDVAFGTAASIAAKAQVQPSTLVRFSQALGYQGFSDLQDVFRARLRDQVLGYDERMAKLGAHGEASPRAAMILEGFAQASLRSISTLTSRYDPAVFEKALDVLEGARTVYLIGLRRSFPVTAYMAYAMGKLGIRTLLVDGVAGLGAEQAGFAQKGDAAIAISFTPYASETVALTAQVREAGARVVALTDSIFSPLAAQAEVWFEIAEADFEGFRSMSATMTLAMAITVALADRRKAKR